MRMEGKLGKLVEIVDPQASGEHAEHVDPPKVTQQAMPSDFALSAISSFTRRTCLIGPCPKHIVQGPAGVGRCVFCFYLGVHIIVE